MGTMPGQAQMMVMYPQGFMPQQNLGGPGMSGPDGYGCQGGPHGGGGGPGQHGGGMMQQPPMYQQMQMGGGGPPHQQ